MVTVLVNGVAISQAVLGSRNGDQKEKEDKTEYTLDIRTQDRNQVTRTTLAADNEDILWVYGQVRCNKPEVDTSSLTQALSFSTEGPDVSWLVLGKAQMVEGFKVVQVRAGPPFPDAQLTAGQASVRVSTIIEGKQISGPVRLDLSRLIIEVLV